MEEFWNKNDSEVKPDMDRIKDFVDSPLWNELCLWIEKTYAPVRPVIEFSRCSMQQGWNIKYRKGGRSLCTLYPENGYFTALVVIGEKEKLPFEISLPAMSQYTQTLYKNTKEGMGQKWLMFEVRERCIYEDVKACITMRRKPKNTV